MKTFSLNIRSFKIEGKDDVVGWCRRLIVKEKSSFVTLQETKLHLVDLHWIQSLWGSDNCNFIQKEMLGKSGGQLLIWYTITFEALDVIVSDFYIDIKGFWKSLGIGLNIINVYGPHDDINKQRIARRFNDFITNSSLIEIPLGGRNFTQVSEDGIKFSKLDRFLVNQIFIDMWKDLMALALDRQYSDHCLIILKDEDRNFGPKPFRIFNVWLEDDEAESIITNAWGLPVTNIDRKDCVFRNKLKNVKNALKVWSNNKFSKLDIEIDKLKSAAIGFELRAKNGPLSGPELELWRETRKQWLDKERIKGEMVKQKARARWVVEGDENTKFFHSLIKRNNNKCNIRGLSINGVWNDSPKDIKSEAFNHFSKIFKEDDCERPSLEDLSYTTISIEEANVLEVCFDEKEIHDAILDCGSKKAPGPDGFNMKFFKRYWDVIKTDLVYAIWNKGEFSRGCNAFFVKLIPKKTDAIGLGDFRPISLIGSYDKIISKVLSSRLRKILPSLIGSEQSAFLKGRYILGGALIVNESIGF
ncbi:uncharacterized protein [Rutidosis leptorrhynchoides]|uniref:uncharacterized protein n=1 Tax=Rutidosis leptorrhynchoides TaxID=125765 RepID=UPI003A9A0524